MRRAWVLGAILTILSGCTHSDVHTFVSDDPPPPVIAAPLDAAHAIVLDRPYPSLVIEIDYWEGSVPSKVALRDLIDIIHAETLKKQIQIVGPDPIPSGLVKRAGAEWTLDEVKRAHETTFHSHPDPWALGNGTTAFLHVLYLNGSLRYDYLGKNMSAAGVTLDNVVVVLWSPSIVSVRGQPLVPAPAEADNADRDILIHEFGHAMGLINRGAPPTRHHSPPDDPYHSSDPASIMYAGRDTIGALQHTAHDSTASGTALFDADDLADLAALSGQAAAQAANAVSQRK